MKKILYNDEKGLNIITPLIALDAKIIAEKDVPAGLLFMIVDADQLPKDRSNRNAWECDINESNAHGIGLTKEEFDKKYPKIKNMSVN